jgi:hypothetical protein
MERGLILQIISITAISTCISIGIDSSFSPQVSLAEQQPTVMMTTVQLQRFDQTFIATIYDI